MLTFTFLKLKNAETQHLFNKGPHLFFKVILCFGEQTGRYLLPRSLSTFGCVNFDLPCALNSQQAAHHVVPQALAQLLVPLYGEVEAVVSEEGHIDLPVLHGGNKTFAADLGLISAKGDLVC